MTELMKVKPEVPSAPIERSVHRELNFLNYVTLDQFNKAVNVTQPDPVDGINWKITDIDFWDNEIWVTWTLPILETERIEWEKKLTQYHADMKIWNSQYDLRQRQYIEIQRELNLTRQKENIDRLRKELSYAERRFEKEFGE